MKRTTAPLLLAALLVTTACGTRDVHVFRDVPYCLVDAPGVEPDFDHQYVVLTTLDPLGGDQVDPVRVQRLSPDGDDLTPLGYQAPAGMRLVLVQCAKEATVVEPTRLSKEPGTSLPHLCDEQTVLIDRTLEATTPSERDAALGIDGVYEFPVIELSCTAGTVARHRNLTLAQIWSQLDASLERYHSAHDGGRPSSMAELTAATQQPPLPLDPWGRPFTVQFGEHVEVRSPGADGKPGTTDDVLAYSSGGGHGRITSFAYDGVPEHNPAGSYAHLLHSRGVIE